MENLIIGIIGITIGFCIGHILGSRREIERHRLCHRRQKEAREKMHGFSKFLGIDIGHEIDRAVAFQAEVKQGKITSIKPVELPKDFGKMKDEIKTTETVVPVIRKRKPRNAAQKKAARDKMRIYRARKRKAQK